MTLTLYTLGHKLPTWVTQQCQRYQQRLPQSMRLDICELTPKARLKHQSQATIRKLDHGILTDKIPRSGLTITLDEGGKQLSSEALATQLDKWLQRSSNLAFFIGGNEGLPREFIAQADFNWSLSQLTLPHQMVPLIVCEQLYRAVSILNQHPYHRS